MNVNRFLFLVVCICFCWFTCVLLYDNTIVMFKIALKWLTNDGLFSINSSKFHRFQSESYWTVYSSLFWDLSFYWQTYTKIAECFGIRHNFQLYRVLVMDWRRPSVFFLPNEFLWEMRTPFSLSFSLSLVLPYSHLAIKDGGFVIYWLRTRSEKKERYIVLSAYFLIAIYSFVLIHWQT